MPRLMISGTAHAFADDPRSNEPVTDQRLQQVHGMFSRDLCSRYLEGLEDVVAGGGRLRFVFDDSSGGLRITTSYDVHREPTVDERDELVKQTLSQWADGMGSGSFECFHGEAFSTALAMAILNQHPGAELGGLFVDAYPYVEDRDVRVDFDPSAGADDELMADLNAAVEAGNPDALIDLGDRLRRGQGVEKDEAAAFSMFKRAAEAGHPVGAFHTGLCLDQGIGTPEDKSAAFSYFQESAEAGFPPGMHFMGEYLAEGIVGEADPKAAFEWYERGASTGNPGCLAELGDCFEFGNGVEKNLARAMECYEAALAQGFDAVQEAIERVQKELDG